MGRRSNPVNLRRFNDTVEKLTDAMGMPKHLGKRDLWKDRNIMAQMRVWSGQGKRPLWRANK